MIINDVAIAGKSIGTYVHSWPSCRKPDATIHEVVASITGKRVHWRTSPDGMVELWNSRTGKWLVFKCARPQDLFS